MYHELLEQFINLIIQVALESKPNMSASDNHQTNNSKKVPTHSSATKWISRRIVAPQEYSIILEGSNGNWQNSISDKCIKVEWEEGVSFQITTSAFINRLMWAKVAPQVWRTMHCLRAADFISQWENLIWNVFRKRTNIDFKNSHYFVS